MCRKALSLGRGIFALSLLLIQVNEARSGSGMIVSAIINGKSARMELDTGSSKICLYQAAAKRLGIERPIFGVRKAGVSTRLWTSQDHVITLRWPGGSSSRFVTSLEVIEPPHNLTLIDDVDGLIGWGTVSENIVEFDGVHSTFKFLSEVPVEARSWTRATVLTNDPSAGTVLALELRATGNSNIVLFVRTGIRGGLGLPWPNWHEWKTNHPNQFSTMNGYYDLEWGRVVREQAWVGAFALGPLKLTDMVIEEGAKILWGTNYSNISFLGRDALSRLDLLVDGPNRVAYLRPKQTRGAGRNHNRLGALFLPPDSKSTTLVAFVAKPSPAFAAGVRDGDVLTRLDEIDVTRWWLGEGFSLDERLNGVAFIMVFIIFVRFFILFVFFRMV
jgi:hypothetical protein